MIVSSHEELHRWQCCVCYFSGCLVVGGLSVEGLGPQGPTGASGGPLASQPETRLVAVPPVAAVPPLLQPPFVRCLYTRVFFSAAGRGVPLHRGPQGVLTDTKHPHDPTASYLTSQLANRSGVDALQLAHKDLGSRVEA